MQGRKGTTEVMEIPATAAALADLLLTNTLPGTWISSRSLQPSWGRRIEKDRGGTYKKDITCRKSKVFEDMSCFIQSFKVGIIFSVIWTKRIQGQLISNKPLFSLQGRNMGKTHETQQEWAAMIQFPYRYNKVCELLVVCPCISTITDRTLHSRTSEIQQQYNQILSLLVMLQLDLMFLFASGWLSFQVDRK